MNNYLLKNIFINKKKYNLSNWMNEYYSKIKDKTLKDIPIIGSHDSGSYSCNGVYGISPKSGFPNNLYFLSKIFRLDYKFYNWSIDQRSKIQEQLYNGIRYFDLRICLSILDNKIRIIHGFYGVELSIILTEIVNFLNINPNEFIILNLSEFSWTKKKDMNIVSHIFLSKKINDIFGSYLIKNNDKNKTIKELRKNKGRILIIYGDYYQNYDLSNTIKTIDNQYIIDGKDILYKPWPNCQKTTDILNYFEKHMSTYKQINQKTFIVYKTPLTPNKNMIIKGSLLPCLFVSSTKELSLKNKPFIINWFKENWNKLSVNIITFDWVDLKDCSNFLIWILEKI